MLRVMDERGAGAPWHELEGVPAGREVVPGLLRGLLIPGLQRSSWAKLEELLGWQTDDPLFTEVAGRLFELLPRLDTRRRARVLGFLAQKAHLVCERPAGVHRRTFLAFTGAGHRVLPMVPDRSAEVRTRAAWLLRELRGQDPAVLGALRKQAAEEPDPTALVAQLLAVGRLSGSEDPGETTGWVRPWLDHRDAHVRLAAAWAVLLVAAPDGAEGTGRRLAEIFAEIGNGRLPDVPWGYYRFTPIEQCARPLSAHPLEAAALVDGLSRHRNADLREEAVTVAGMQLRYWRHPSAHLWETVAAGLEDEAGVATEALEVFARGGTAAAPYADRLARFAKRSGLDRFGSRPDPECPSTDYAVQALVGIGDDRARAWYRGRFGSFYLSVDSLPERWAPDLLPAFRKRLSSASEAGSVSEVLEILARWGPSAAPAVPELTRLLDTPLARPAAEALGRIGPAASAAADALAALARSESLPWGGGYPPRPWQGAQTAAWAHWRVTGDPELALRVCGSAAQAGPGRPVLRYLADLGPLAAPYADAVGALLGSYGEWTRVGAAEAWWRITGDADTAVATLLPELRPLDDHLVDPLVLQTVRALGAIGRPSAVALPVLHAVIASERRYGADIRRDEELCGVTREALDRIEGP